MENEKLNIVEYLKNVSELEGSVYKQKVISKEAHNNLKRSEPKLKEPDIEKPVKDRDEPKKPDNLANGCSWIFAIGLSLCAVGAIFCFQNENIFFGVVLAFLGIIGIFYLLFMISFARSYPDELIKYENELKEYEEYEKDYNLNVEKYEKEYNKLLKENQNIFEKENEQADINFSLAKEKVIKLDEYLCQTQDILAKAYDADIIFPKYRNLVAITTIYEYFASGRVTELEGPNGAYNLYEAELRQNLIINQLDTISQNLESIKNNQYVLYTQLHDLNETTKNISTDLSNILSLTEGIYKNTYIDAYYSQVTASNTACMKSLATMDYIFK